MTTKTHISAESRAEQARQTYRETAAQAAAGDLAARTKMPKLFAALEAAEHEAKISAAVVADIAKAQEDRRQAEAAAADANRRRTTLEEGLQALEERERLAAELVAGVEKLAGTWAQFERATAAIRRARPFLPTNRAPLEVGNPEPEWLLGILSRALPALENPDASFWRTYAPQDLVKAIARRNRANRRILATALGTEEAAA